jgi:hypothetical protein
MIDAHLGEIREPVGSQREPVLRSPQFILAPFKQQVIHRTTDAVSAPFANLLSGLIKQKRLYKGISETYIRKPSLIKLDEQGQVIEGGTKSAALFRHCGRKQFHVETQPAKQRRESPVQLVAEPASPGFDNLRDYAHLIEHDLFSPVYVEILERHQKHMRAVKPSQSFGRRLKRPRVIYSFQVSSQVHTELLSKSF